jgi:hypothetical protein
MKTSVLLGLAAVLVAASAQAACGGGGWKPSSSTGAESDYHMPEKPGRTQGHEATTVSTSTTPLKSENNLQYPITRVEAKPREVLAAPAAPVLDTAKFDAGSAKLQINEEQASQVERAKASVRKQIEKLAKDETKARDKYNKCSGDCANERQKALRASEALRKFDTQREFEARLTAILKESQLQAYKSL